MDTKGHKMIMERRTGGFDSARQCGQGASSGRRRREGGFTLRDLVAVLATLSLLTCVLLPARGQARSGSGTIVCLNNLAQLIRGWQMATEEAGGVLPANASGGVVGRTPVPWVSGWLDFGPSPDNTNQLYLTSPSYSSVGPYVGDVSRFRCPEDLSTVVRSGQRLPRVRSYSMNGAIGDSQPAFLGFGYRTYLKLSDITDPSPGQLWVFIDEHPDSINDGDFALTMPSGPAATQWVDFPAWGHDEGGALAFADGHAEVHRWVDPRTRIPVRYGQATLNVPSPNNPDVLWLAARTSARNR